MGDKMKDLAERAAHAFWQGGLASLPVTVPMDRGALEVALLAFVTGGCSAVLSLAKGMVKARRSGSSR